MLPHARGRNGSQRRPRFVLSLILMLGCLVPWWFGLMMVSLGLSQLGVFPPERSEQHYLRVQHDGNVIKVKIERFSSSYEIDAQSTTYELLTGEPINAKEVSHRRTDLIPAPVVLKNVVNAYTYHGSMGENTAAGMIGFLHPQQTDQSWYFYFTKTNVWLDQALGHFEVFDRRSRQRLFYLGKKGKSATFPALEERFEFSLSPMLPRANVLLPDGRFGVVFGFQGGDERDLEFNERLPEQNRLEEVRLLTRAGEIWRIDMNTLVVDRLPLSGPVCALNWLSSMRFLEPEQQEKPDSEVATEATSRGAGERNKVNVFCWNTAEEITLQVASDPTRTVTLSLPEQLQQHEQFSFTLLPDQTVLYQVTTMPQENLKTTDLYWAERDGTLQKTALAVLEQQIPSRRHDDLSSYFMMQPFPAQFLRSLMTVRATEAERGAPITAENFFQNLLVGWDMALLMLVLAVGTAGVYWVRSRKLRRPLAWWELPFVFATGPFGYLSLWFQQKSTGVDFSEQADLRQGIDVLHPVAENKSAVLVST